MSRPLIALALLLGTSLPSPPARGGLFGFAVGVHPAEARRQRFAYPPRLDQVRALGASAVLLAPMLPVRDVRGSRVRPGDAREHLRVARRARARGLAVVWMPRLALERAAANEWRGVLAPTDRSRFWQTYRDAITTHARWAERAGASLFAIGSELSSLSGPETEDHWAAVARAARAETAMPLAYVANHDAFDRSGPFAAVDVVGVSAYVPVRRNTDAAWAWAARRMGALAERTGKPLVVFELGCPSRAGALAAPWDDSAATPVDLEAQRSYYAAARRALEGRPWLHGLFFWEAFGPGGPHDRSYTPMGKPAMVEAGRLLWGRHPRGSLSRLPRR